MNTKCKHREQTWFSLFIVCNPPDSQQAVNSTAANIHSHFVPNL